MNRNAIPWHLRARLRASRLLSLAGGRLLEHGLNVLDVVEGPRLAMGPERAAAYDALFEEAVRTGGAVDYRLPHPRHEFLSYLVHGRGLLAHGSDRDDIEEFEPRPANEAGAIQLGVHAAADGIWPMFFATVARGGRLVLSNGCYHVGSGDRLRRYYYFGFSRDPDDPASWTTGSVYLLSRDTFRRHLLQEWISDAPVRPLARLRVAPEDFPFRRSTVQVRWPEMPGRTRRRFRRRHERVASLSGW